MKLTPVLTNKTSNASLASYQSSDSGSSSSDESQALTAPAAPAAVASAATAVALTSSTSHPCGLVVVNNHNRQQQYALSSTMPTSMSMMSFPVSSGSIAATSATSGGGGHHGGFGPKVLVQSAIPPRVAFDNPSTSQWRNPGQPASPSGSLKSNRCGSSAGCGSSSACSGSRASVATDICRICHCEGTADYPLITPCYCAGTLRFVHQKCLQQWIKSSQTRNCEVCRYGFIMETKLKPFRRWEKLDMTSVERRKVLCSVSFHVIAITCVVWSLYVLIERTAEEIRNGQLDWPFWTKLVVVAIGFTGGLVFMYVQCKMYMQLFRRWRAYNKVIFVQDCPERRGGGSSNNNNNNNNNNAVIMIGGSGNLHGVIHALSDFGHNSSPPLNNSRGGGGDDTMIMLP